MGGIRSKLVEDYNVRTLYFTPSHPSRCRLYYTLREEIIVGRNEELAYPIRRQGVLKYN